MLEQKTNQGIKINLDSGINVKRVLSKNKGRVMNVYEVQVKARCPLDHGIDVYEFRLESKEIILCDDILKFFANNAGNRKVYQEALTKQCATALGCRAASVGHHSGIKVTCVSPA